VRQVTKRRPTRGRIATETLESSSARDTTEGILTAAPVVCRKARQGGGLGPAGKHEVCVARHAPSQLPVGLEPVRRCPRRRRGMSETGTGEVNAAPADEARVVHLSRRREALPPTCLSRDRGFSRKREPAGE